MFRWLPSLSPAPCLEWLLTGLGVGCGGAFYKLGKQPRPKDCVVAGLASMRHCPQFLAKIKVSFIWNTALGSARAGRAGRWVCPRCVDADKEKALADSSVSLCRIELEDW